MKIVLMILQWGLALFSFLFIFLEIGVGSILFVLATILFLPIQKLREFLLNKLKLRAWLACLMAVILFFAGILMSPGMTYNSDVDSFSRNSENIDDIESSLEKNSFEEASSMENISKEESSSEYDSSSEVDNSEQHEHAYVGIIEKMPTCSEQGCKKFVCECGNFYTEEIAVLTHVLVLKGSEAATCTQFGWNAYEYCENCSYTTYEEIFALGHNFVNGICVRCLEKDPDYKEDDTVKITYILNIDSMKIHFSTCRHVDRMSEENKQATTKTLEELLEEGYTKCGTCF